jgi:hypothetical protein
MHRFMLLMACAGSAAAHDGRGAASAAHLHASDLFGLVLIAAAVGGWCLLRGRR